MRIVVCVTPGLPPKTVDTRLGTPSARGSRAVYPANSLLVPIGRHDEAALEVALRIRDEFGGVLTAVSSGAQEGMALDSLRNALACGADDALLIEDPGAADRDSHSTAEVLAQAARRYGDPELVIFGRYGSAWEAGVTPPLVAAILRAPFVQGADLRESAAAPGDAGSTVVAAIRRSSAVRLRSPSLASIERAYDADIERVTVDSLPLPEGWALPRVQHTAAPVPVERVSDLPLLADGAGGLADRMIASLSLVNR